MNQDICCRALDLLDREVLIADVAGSVVYANDTARRLIDAPMGDEGALGTFYALWREDEDTVRTIVRRMAGMSSWQPFTLTRASGLHSGLRLHMRGRAFMSGSGEERALHLLVTADPYRERAFDDHRRLIRHLNVKLAEGSRTEALLAGLLDAERRLRRELVHRVKNNLSLLTALLRVNRKRTDDPEAVAQLEEMERRILSMAAVHDLLDLDQETDFVRADRLIERICRELENALAPGRITIRRDLVPVRLHVRDATPLALIVNELVTNALKHAFPRENGGTITIELKKNGVEKLEATVHDDGVGMVVPVGGSAQGQGRSILQALAEQLQGEVAHSTQDGTRWQLVFAPRMDEGFEPTPEPESVA